jgi:hypothetical protein
MAMQEKKYSPVKVPTITLTPVEIDEMYDLIDKGELPNNYVDRYFEAVQDNVFGVDHKKDRKGNPIEQGIGSPGNQTRNSIEAYAKYTRDEPEVKAKNIERMERELAESNERRRAAADKKGGTKRRYSA